MDFQIGGSSLVDVCRICLQNKNNEIGGYQRMTEMSATIDSINISLFELFFTFAGLPMDQAEGFPRQICENCQDTLVLAYEFKMKCLQSDQNIRMALENSDTKPILNDPNKTEQHVEEMSIQNYDNDHLFKDELGISSEIWTEPLNINESSNSSQQFEPPIGADSSSKSLEIRKKNKKCEFCNKTFYRSYNLNRHMDIHKPEGKPFECKICKRRFADESRMKLHQENHSFDDLPSVKMEEAADGDEMKILQKKKNIYECLVCDKSFAKPSLLFHHSKKEHKKFQCKICKQKFMDKSSLIYHEILHSTNMLDVVPESTADQQSEDCQEDDVLVKSNEISDVSAIEPSSKVAKGKKQYICQVCNRTFSKGSHLIRHYKVHDPEGKPFECKFCKRRFAEERLLMSHEFTHSKDLMRSKRINHKFYECPDCPREFLNKDSLSSHSKLHQAGHNQNVYTCEHCKSIYSEQSNYLQHIKTHINPKIFSCKKCDQTFAVFKEYVKHRKSHKKFCSFCNKIYTNDQALNDHIRQSHTGERPHLCSICGKSFITRNTLRNHMMTHTDNKKFQCSICLVRKFTRADLKWHMTTHSDIKAFKCDICGASFSAPGGLRLHKYRRHDPDGLSKIKRLACNLCDLKFPTKYALACHIRTHTGEKPFKCELCDRAYSQSGDLNKHRRQIHGIDIFKCKQCPASFQMLSELKKHNHQVHYLPQPETSNTIVTATDEK